MNEAVVGLTVRDWRATRRVEQCTPLALGGIHFGTSSIEAVKR